MSYNSCAKQNVSDNKHSTCPARMSDGRLFTNYNSRCAIMASVVPEADTGHPSGMDSYTMRQYMIHNAEAIINNQRGAASCVAHCGPCKDTMLPESQIDSCDPVHCVRRSTGAPGGLGLGRDYGGAYIAQQADIPGAFTPTAGGSPL